MPPGEDRGRGFVGRLVGHGGGMLVRLLARRLVDVSRGGSENKMNISRRRANNASLKLRKEQMLDQF